MLVNSVKIHDLAKYLIKFQIYYNCVIKFCIGHLGIPSFANYVTDLVTLVLMMLMLYCRHFTIKKSSQFTVAMMFVIVVIISYIGNGYSAMLLIWGGRNLFRFYLFFFACIYFLDVCDFDNIMSGLKILFWVNIVLILYQKWGLNYIGDACSGLYSLGNISGGNGSVNILMYVVVCYVLAEQSEKKMKVRTTILYLISAFAVAAVIELKYFFIEMIVIIFIYVGVKRKSIRTWGFLCVSLLALFWGIDLLQKINPSFAGFFQIQEIIDDSMQYGVSEQVGRLSGMRVMLENYLTTPFQKLFGIGLGNADYSSSFDVFTSSFYRQHYSLTYYYFMSAWMMVETGILGTITYLLMFLLAIYKSWKMCKTKDFHAYAAFMLCISALLQFFYNQMLRVETSGYLLQLTLALVFIMQKEKIKMRKY